MEYSEVNDLARIASGGDLAALNVLLATVRPDVLRMCSRLLANPEDAEEACQDTLFAVARGISRFDGRSAFRTWLYRVAVNRARTAHTAKGRRPTGYLDPLAEIADPRRTSVVASTRIDLLQALAQLKPEFAEAVALRDAMGLSYGEIATLQEVPEGTVKSRIHEARRQLRSRLSADRG
jgi:RNA polymerase sigma-70 factor (ECF subfamily)